MLWKRGVDPCEGLDMKCPSCGHVGDFDEFHGEDDAFAYGFADCPACGHSDDVEEFEGDAE